MIQLFKNCCRQRRVIFRRYLCAALVATIFGGSSLPLSADTTNNAVSLDRDYHLRLDQYKLSVAEHTLHLEEHLLSRQNFYLTLAGIIGSAMALAFGFFQYRKAELWKRAEFLAKEMKDFFGDPAVQKVILMIDWSQRYIRFENHGNETDTKVTRELQVSALQPHTFLTHDYGSDAEEAAAPLAAASQLPSGVGVKSKFTASETAIRDAYDRFLDFLERFGSYLETHLFETKELDPYLRYWIDDIAAHTENPDDAAWTCALFAYIEFYGYEGVQRLFSKYSYDISVGGEIFSEQAKVITDQAWILRLKEACPKSREK